MKALPIFLAAPLILLLTACDGAQDPPERPPGAIGTEPAVNPPGQQCTQEAKICPDGSLARIVEGTCEQKCD